MSRPSSVWEGSDRDFLQWAIPFYWRREGEPRSLDANYGGGRFWRGTHGPTVSLDIQALADVKADNCHLPFRPETFDVVVYDPPHMADNRGVTLSRYASGVPNSVAFLPEAFRVLLGGGVLLAKVADAVHAQHSNWPHIEFMGKAPYSGFAVCDLIVKVRSAALIDPKWKNAYHARKRHCFWIICRKGKC